MQEIRLPGSGYQILLTSETVLGLSSFSITYYVVLDQLLNLSMHQSIHLIYGNNNGTYLVGGD